MAFFRVERTEVPETREDEEVFNASISDIVARCKAADIEVVIDKDALFYNGEYNIQIPQGRGKREVNLWTAEGAKAFSSIDFENYNFIARHNAIYSQKHDLIEAAVRPLNPRSFTSVKRRLFSSKEEHSEDEAFNQIVCFDSADGARLIELGAASEAFRALAQLYRNESTITVRLSGFGAQQHDRALQTLETATNALFMQLDLTAGVPLALVKERKFRSLTSKSKGVPDAVLAMPFPKYEYDPGPFSLYQYGRSADGMPLLQFLAFYQVAEYFYPTYSDANARRRVRNILKDPRFRESREADIGRLMSAINSKHGRNGGERAQLKATISECVDTTSLKEFIDSAQSRSEFYRNPPKKSRHTKLVLSGDDNDIITTLTNRLYEIRCEIVHTKDIDDKEEKDMPRLLPFSAEADQLEHDISLMQFVAQKVLIASSKPSETF